MKIEIEITVKEIEDGLFVASFNGKEISHGRTIYKAVERAKEFLKKSLQAF
jgi:predicted RNase H-like HicB family nuclease